jgi:hypothetical protein
VNNLPDGEAAKTTDIDASRIDIQPQIQSATISSLVDDKTEKRIFEARTDRDGDPLPAGALVRMGSVRFRRPGHVSSVAFCDDGKIAISGSSMGGAIRMTSASQK